MRTSRASIFLFSLPPWPLFSCTPILRARSPCPDFLFLCTFRSPHASFRLRVYFALRAHRFSPTRSHPSHAPSPVRTLRLPSCNLLLPHAFRLSMRTITSPSPLFMHAPVFRAFLPPSRPAGKAKAEPICGSAPCIFPSQPCAYSPFFPKKPATAPVRGS